MLQNGKYLLDTNIVIAMFANEVNIEEERQYTGKVFLPSPVIGELYYGARNSDRPIENIARINRLTERIPNISCNLETARWYGIIKNQLRRKGHLIPDNDIWIAAIALQRELILVTRDAHFNEVESLHLEKW
ncbi:MAG: type II toxin-antitoxin system VapC family toxin [Candidatus Poribacteria bacterium]|nr:type II toxin-antitoxin system VapC family toxin [Candidatus Poribacteria bacterium]